MNHDEIKTPRRNVIAGAGLGLAATALTACSSYGKPAASSASSAPAAPGSSGAPATGAALAKTADVPVGSGVIVGDIVVTQPTAGVFKGFSTVCPHAGCNVSKVQDGNIVCPCHGSMFSLEGAVVQGPAKKPLETKAVSVQGDSIVAG
ncbi:Rieske (2Fe-2S) protein [Mycolicibacterium sp. P9-64]|uniref:Rieske (2Fe-2S) protein n=1 Tax=Mycolicibacterium sp. P9-64 TaxID=2024612 RepID=UPI0011F03F7C|nr:Rieske (2Fe-2S) protein [Mycolicibacterium sp. P9-64]KAA0081875.1 Rieske (2Fe-2S) protein [Mycolicibacterium sp. P9-64]